MYLNSGRLRPRVGKKKKNSARAGGARGRPPGGSGFGVRGDPRGGPDRGPRGVQNRDLGVQNRDLGVQNRHFGGPGGGKIAIFGKILHFFAIFPDLNMDFLLRGAQNGGSGGPEAWLLMTIFDFLSIFGHRKRGQIWIFALSRVEGAKFCKIFEKWAFFAPYDLRQPPRVAQKKQEKSRFFLLQALSNAPVPINFRITFC